MIFIILSLFIIREHSENSIILDYLNQNIVERTIIAIPQEGMIEYSVFNEERRLNNDLIKIMGPYNFRNRRILIIEPDTLKTKIYEQIKILINFEKRGITYPNKNKYIESIILNDKEHSYYLKNSGLKEKTFNNGIRISVDSPGVYKVSFRMLTRNNINFSPQINRIKLTYKDKVVPIDVYDTDRNNIFDNNDYFIFYAEDYKSYFDTLSHYWLNEDTGKYYIHINTDENMEMLRFFKDSIVFDEERIYSRTSGDWYYAQDTIFNFYIDTINFYDNISIIKLKFYNNSYYENNLSIFLNDNFINTYTLQGNSTGEIQCTTDIRFQNIKITSSSFVYLKYLKIIYNSRFISDGVKIRFKSEKNNFKVLIENFLSNKINILRIDGYKILNYSIEESLNRYKITFSDTTSGNGKYIVYISGSEKTPKEIKYVDIYTKFNLFNGSDCIVITPPIFYDYAMNYKNYYENTESISIAVFTTDDIYNAFNFGEKSPYAIKEFLKYCMGLENPPSYLTIMGKGTYDPKNICKNNSDLVPVIMKNMIGGYYSSDFEYTKLCGEDDFPDIVVGRIPALNPIEMNGYIDKIINGLKSVEPKENRLFFGADYALQNSDSISNGIIKSIVPSGYNITRVYSREGTSVWEEVISTLSYGQTIFNFHGHGGEEDLGAGRYFRIYDIPRLTNFGKLTFMLGFSCANGIIDDPIIRSVSEYSVIFPGVGMIGSVAPSGLTYFTDNVSTDKYLLNGIFRRDLRRLGDILFYYKFLYPESYNSGCYHLIGDPLFRLKIAKDTLNFTNFYKNDTLNIRSLININGKFYFKIIDSLKIYEYSFNITDSQKDTSIPIIFDSQYPKIIALFKNNEIILSGEQFISKRDIFERIFFYPDESGLNDTLNILTKLKFIPDSIIYLFGYEGNINNKIVYDEESDSFFCRIPITREGSNFNFRIEVYDSSGIYNSRTFSKYILKRADLKFLNEPEFILRDSLLFSINIINSGEKKIDSTTISIYKFFNDYEIIFDTLIRDIKSTGKINMLIPFDSYIDDTILNFKVEIDRNNWINEYIENNNIVYYNKKRDFYKINHKDTNIIYDKYFKIIFPPETSNKDFYISIVETEYKEPIKQKDFKPGKFDDIEKSFRINFGDTLLKPYFIKLFPDSNDGSIYLKRNGKWIYLAGDSLWIKDTGEFTYGFNNDKMEPIIKIKNDSIYSKDGNIDINLIVEDENGIDIWIRKPYFFINDEEITPQMNKTRDMNIMNFNIEKFLPDGFYNVKFFVYDVHGNFNSRDIFINIQTPFLITFLSNYPNPANDRTKFVIEFTKKPDSTTIEIYQPSGNLVESKTIYNLNEGRNIIEWDLKDDKGKIVPNGVYLYVVRAKKGLLKIEEKRKMAVLKR